MAHLDAALALAPDGEQQWRAHADADHESISSMFGGWSAAVLLRAVSATAANASTPSIGQPSALTVNFIRPVAPGSEVAITASRLGGGRSLEHWRADLRSVVDDEADASELLVTALVVLTNRRESEPHLQFEMPTVPPPDDLERIHAPGPQGQQTEIRQVAGEWGSGDTRGCLWVRDASGRALDHLQLAYLADQYRAAVVLLGRRDAALGDHHVVGLLPRHRRRARRRRHRLRPQRGHRYTRRALDVGPAGALVES